MKYINKTSVALLVSLLVACSSPVHKIAGEGSSSSTTSRSSASPSRISSSSISNEEQISRWMKNFRIDLKEGDSLYGLTVTSFDPPRIHLRGESPISGMLEWKIFYDIPALFFLPDVPVEEKYKRDFIVSNSDIFPIRQGAKVRVTVEDMGLVFMESNMPSSVDLKNVEVIGEPYESISETSAEWQYYLQLKRDDPNNPQLQ